MEIASESHSRLGTQPTYLERAGQLHTAVLDVYREDPPQNPPNAMHPTGNADSPMDASQAAITGLAVLCACSRSIRTLAMATVCMAYQVLQSRTVQLVCHVATATQQQPGKSAWAVTFSWSENGSVTSFGLLVEATEHVTVKTSFIDATLCIFAFHWTCQFAKNGKSLCALSLTQLLDPV